jgi:succinate dehydrogenase / fumarate reductase membrane anchor subunit
MVNKIMGIGLRDWLAQRFSSLIIGAYFVVLLGFFITHKPLDFNILRNFFSTLWVQIFTLVALLSFVLHAWVGIWTVITDYINFPVARLYIQGIVILALIIYFLWGVEILWRLV